MDLNRLIKIQALFGNNLFLLQMNADSPTDHTDSLNYLNHYIQNISWNDIKIGLNQLVEFMKHVLFTLSKKYSYLIDNTNNATWKNIDLNNFQLEMNKVMSCLNLIVNAIEIINKEAKKENSKWTINDTKKYQEKKEVILINNELNNIFSTLKQLINNNKDWIRSVEWDSKPVIETLNQLIKINWLSINTHSTNEIKLIWNLIHQVEIHLKNIINFIKLKVKREEQNEELMLLNCLHLQLFTILVGLEIIFEHLFCNIKRWIAFYITIDDNTINYLNNSLNLNNSKNEIEKKINKFIMNLNINSTNNASNLNNYQDLIDWNLNLLQDMDLLDSKLSHEQIRANAKESMVESLITKIKDKEKKEEENERQINEMKQKIQNNLDLINEKEIKLEELNKQLVEKENQLLLLNTTVSTNDHRNNNTISNNNTNNNNHDNNVINNNKIIIDDKLKFKNYLNKEDITNDKIARKQYESKIKALNEQVEKADSEATHYYHEWLQLSEKLNQIELNNQNLNEELLLVKKELKIEKVTK
ncbi:hypothetical protein K502DRAFT_323168 [Neoconidiobolus thromboides FSU 785]|nr:hypothetical protein K502DRAFT_323168 [Neoconidiobolus thromboides FSU 785]